MFDNGAEHVTVTVESKSAQEIPYQSAKQIEREIERLERAAEQNRAQRRAELNRAVEFSMTQDHINHLAEHDGSIERLHQQQMTDLRTKLKVRQQYEQRQAQEEQRESGEAAKLLEAAEKARAGKVWADKGGDMRDFENLWPELYNGILRNKVIDEVKQMDTARVVQMRMFLSEF